MNDDIFDDGKITVTSFCGGEIRPGVHRTMYQMSIQRDHVIYNHKQLVTALETLLTTLTGIKSG